MGVMRVMTLEEANVVSGGFLDVRNPYEGKPGMPTNPEDWFSGNDSWHGFDSKSPSTPAPTPAPDRDSEAAKQAAEEANRKASAELQAKLEFKHTNEDGKKKDEVSASLTLIIKWP